MWSLGSVAGLEIDGAPFFLHEPVKINFTSPEELGARTARVELFVDDPDSVIARALAAGTIGGDIKDHIRAWGKHRQAPAALPLDLGGLPPADAHRSSANPD